MLHPSANRPPYNDGPMSRPPFYRSLYAQVLAAIAVGVVVGVLWPEKGAATRPLGDGFIKLIRILIAPIIAFIYFDVVSTLALAIGLAVVNILQVLLVATLMGLALLGLGGRVEGLVAVFDQLSQALFAIVGLIMRLAPIGAFGAMAFTVGRYGIGSLLSLGQLMVGVYITCLLFIILVLGSILRIAGLGLGRFLRYIAEEILIVLGTSSSESALPRLMAKLERL